MSAKPLIMQGSTPLEFMGMEERIKQWVNAAMVRVVTVPIAGTDLIGARIKGLTKLFASAVTNEDAICVLEGYAVQYAKDKLLRGEPLPDFEKPPVIVPDEVIKCVRLSRLKALIKQRWKAWGVQRDLLPVHALQPLLADFDALITRYAMQVQSSGDTKPKALSPASQRPATTESEMPAEPLPQASHS